jgi:hypothetical protein
MARCEKCLMDPCLCHIDSFGPDEEDTTEKDIKEIMGKRCIVKTTWEGDKVLAKAVKEYTPQDRATDVTGKIVSIGATPTSGLISEFQEFKEKPLMPIFFIKYDEPGPKNIPGHWYLDEEIIYL